MFNMGWTEIIVILIVALIIFGPGKLPDVGRALGKTIREFKGAVNKVDLDLKKEMDDIKEAVNIKDVITIKDLTQAKAEPVQATAETPDSAEKTEVIEEKKTDKK